eukprot:COSAG06_NODE_32243_length_509_cov_0.846341_1_plen_86_part_10
MRTDRRTEVADLHPPVVSKQVVDREREQHRHDGRDYRQGEQQRREIRRADARLKREALGRKGAERPVEVLQAIHPPDSQAQPGAGA